MTIADITSSIAVICSVIAIYLAVRRAPHETESLDAETVKTYQETANLAGERANCLEKELADVKKKLKQQQLLLDELTGRNENLQERVTILENENGELKRLIRYLQNEIDERDGTLEQIKRWAEMLVGELKRNNLPVPAMPEKTQPRKAV